MKRKDVGFKDFPFIPDELGGEFICFGKISVKKIFANKITAARRVVVLRKYL